MEHARKIFDVCVAGAGVTLSAVLGEWDTSLRILLVCIVLDYILGLAKAAYKGELSSSIGWKGLMRKSVIFVVIIIAHQLDILAGNTAPVFRVASSYFYIANEAISITENIALLDVPLPGFLVKALKVFKTNVENMTPEVKFNEKN